MPNWVYNKVTSSNKVIRKLLDSKGNPTFEKVLPMPSQLHFLDTYGDSYRSTEEFKQVLSALRSGSLEDLKTYWTSCPRSTQGTFEDYLKYLKENNAFITAMLKEDVYSKYKVDNSYDWRCSEWGCKWDAHPLADPYDVNDKNLTTIEFETPWDYPYGVVKQIFSDNPNEEILWHADEESCAFSFDFENISGSIETHEAFPEYYIPYISTETELLDFIEGETSLEYVKTLIQDSLRCDSLDLCPKIDFKETPKSNNKVDLTVDVYNWYDLGEDLLYTITIEDLIP